MDDVQAAIAAINGRRKTRILQCLAQRPYRFAALRRAVGDISEKVLMQALRDLEADLLVSRSVEETKPPRVEYAMTDHGHSLCDLVSSLEQWGKTHRRLMATRNPD
jgi:DNA-binding HxlR family transcriptional regulator